MVWEKSAKVIIGVILFASVVLSGLLLGSQAAHYKTLKKQLAARKEQTAAILDEMNTIKIGDKLPDHRFEDLESNLVWLSDLLAHKTLISFYHPSCDACVVDFEHMQRKCLESADYEYFLFISSTDPMMLAEQKRQNGIASHYPL